MKRLFFLMALVAQVLTMSAAKSKVVIDRIDPTDWFVGLKNPQVQLMVYGKNIAAVQRVATDYPGDELTMMIFFGCRRSRILKMLSFSVVPRTMLSSMMTRLSS